MNHSSITDALNAYASAGLCALPAIRAEKRPAVERWKQYQTRKPTEAELTAWSANNPDAVCVLCGEASGGLEALDFDAGGELFDAWCRAVPAELLNRLVTSSTPSGGWHVYYLFRGGVSGNMKLAQRKDGEKIVTLIETRGEGGLVLCAPTPGYELAQGDLCRLPIVTAEERDVLLQAAWDLNEYQPPVVDGPTSPARGHVSPPVAHSGPTDRPGDDYGARGDVRALLAQHGWTLVKGGENEYWRRPGKASGTSATLKNRVFYVFSSNAAPFEPGESYGPFAVYTLLEHGGDYEQAARSLRQLGYGGDSLVDNDDGVDISAIVNQGLPAPADSADSPPEIRQLKSLITDFTGLNRPIIHELLREGETMNVIASPKVGKSWFVSRLAISIASGLDWLGLTVEPGRVLHIDNELHENTLAYRYRVISEAMNVPHRLYSGNIDMVSLRGRLRDLYGLARLFEKVTPGQYKLIILDAFYRTLPRDTDENDNGAIANLYNVLDHYAGYLQCAFVLIHHTSKGNQSGKSVTDVGAGAGSQSRAADTHLILRPHEEDGIVVLESAVRSWPPMAPRALKWDWPLFTPVDDVDTSALLGSAKPKAKSREIDLDDFVERCVAAHDPCSQRSVQYEAARQLDLSERRAADMLTLAIERERVARIRIGSSMQYVAARPGVSGDKALWTAALLARDPEANAQEVAEVVGASRQYVNQIRRTIATQLGNSLETDGN